MLAQHSPDGQLALFKTLPSGMPATTASGFAQ